MRLIDTLMVGPKSTGHTRQIYAGHDVELWHETIIPWNIFRLVAEGITDRVYVYPRKLPSKRPAGCKRCAMEEAYYSDGKIPVITWEGGKAFDKAVAWAKEHAPLDTKPLVSIASA